MNTSTEKAHAQAIEEARQALDSAIESAIQDGLEVRCEPRDMTVDGVVYEDARVKPEVCRRITP